MMMKDNVEKRSIVSISIDICICEVFVLKVVTCCIFIVDDLFEIVENIFFFLSRLVLYKRKNLKINQTMSSSSSEEGKTYVTFDCHLILILD